MTDTPARDVSGLIERLRKRAKEDRNYAENSAVVADLLHPQFQAFEEQAGYNVYAVRMAVEHRNTVKRDNAFADDIEAILDALAAFQGREAALREALEPFAALASRVPPHWPDSQHDIGLPAAGLLRRARAALAKDHP